MKKNNYLSDAMAENYENYVRDLSKAFCTIRYAYTGLQYASECAPTETERQRSKELLSTISNGIATLLNEVSTFDEVSEAHYRANMEKKAEYFARKKKGTTDTWENMQNTYDLDPDYLASEERKVCKAKHRKSRKAKRKAKRERNISSVNRCIGKTASKYGKRMIHKYNRRKLDVNTSNYYKHDAYSYSSILWDMT